MAGDPDDPHDDTTSPFAPGRASVPPPSPPPRRRAGEERYARTSRLGVGGMAVVYLCRDGELRRDVAMKTALDSDVGDLEVRALLLREAQIQGGLEHPAIVPVYDVGTTPAGEPFFIMRRVEGTTLRSILNRLRAGDAESIDRYGRRRLLGAFSTVCAAVAFAHARGVLHRDIKPGNVMLGSFGEVYLLDFGVAATLADPAHGEADGGIVGTAGYLSPEQARGEAVDARSDVYSLGAVLFELLTLQRLHPDEHAAALLSTVRGVEARPSVRAPEADVPADLEALCVSATELDPARRISTALEMHEAIERVLDGERYLARRQASANVHAHLARAEILMAMRSGADSHARRDEALDLASHALALDPTNEAAGHVVAAVALLAQPGSEAAEAQRAATKGVRRVLAETGAAMFVPWFVGMGGAALLGVRSWGFATAITSTLLVAAALVVLRKQSEAMWIRVGAYASCQLAAVLSAAAFGPFILMPGLLGCLTMAFAIATLPRASQPAEPALLRRLVIATSALSFLVPIVLELLEVVPPSMSFENGTIVLLPRAVDFPPGLTLAYLAIVQMALVLAPALIVIRVRDHALDIERRAFETASRLRQMLPRHARTAAEEATPTGD